MTNEASYTPGPWVAEPGGGKGAWVKGSTGEWAALACGDTDASAASNARLIAAAPDHALVCWAICSGIARWGSWAIGDGRGEFYTGGMHYSTKLDEFGCPEVTPTIRAALAKAKGE